MEKRTETAFSNINPPHDSVIHSPEDVPSLKGPGFFVGCFPILRTTDRLRIIKTFLHRKETSGSTCVLSCSCEKQKGIRSDCRETSSGGARCLFHIGGHFPLRDCQAAYGIACHVTTQLPWQIFVFHENTWVKKKKSMQMAKSQERQAFGRCLACTTVVPDSAV